MKETDIYDFYCFGYNYRIWKVGFINKKRSYVKKAISEYLANITHLELQVTSQIVLDLVDIAQSLTEKPDEHIDNNLANQIKEIIDGADKALDAELKLKKVLIVTPKRFSQDMLLKYPNKLLAKNTPKYMSQNAKDDFSFAARSIAMNLSTAAAFHLMRSTEEMVKQLYFCYVKQNRIKKPMWGPMVEKLRSKNQPKPSSDLLDHLDLIRKNYRNPTQHPDKFYSIDEAQDLLNSTIVAINMISKSIEDREPTE